MTSHSSVRILVVDDHAMVRLALTEAIEQHHDLELVGEAENGKKALELYREHRPDVVTMDYQLPDQKGDEVIAAIRKEFPEARIVMLSIFETEESLWRAVAAGAIGYVSKAAEINEMIAAVREVARGEPFFSDGLEEVLAQRLAREPLTSREFEVLRLLVKGLSNKEIEVQLEVSSSTVKYHLANVFAKLGVSDRTQAATSAVQRGIVELE